MVSRGLKACVLKSTSCSCLSFCFPASTRWLTTSATPVPTSYHILLVSVGTKHIHGAFIYIKANTHIHQTNTNLNGCELRIQLK